MAVVAAVLSVVLLLQEAACRSFSFRSSANAPGLHVDSTGLTYLAAGNSLYRLNAQLEQEEVVDLGATVINRGLSSDGLSVVVCFEDLSCSVYNASNLGAGPIRRFTNAIASADPDFGAAIFMAGDSFYTGASTGSGMGERMVLKQFGAGFNRSSDNNDQSSGSFTSLMYRVNEFSRQFYSGFVSGNYAYYVVADYDGPTFAGGIRLLRVCNMADCGGPGTCGVTALYEAGFDCGFRSITSDTRVRGVSLVEDFSGITGPTVVISISTPGNFLNSVCILDLTAVNAAMDTKYQSCIVSRTADEAIGLPWRTGSEEVCNDPDLGATGTLCNAPTPVGINLVSTVAPVRVNFADRASPTSSVTVKAEQLSLVFVATNDMDLRIRGFDISEPTSLIGLTITDSFYNQPVSSVIEQLVWQKGQNYITAATKDLVFQVPVEECAQHTYCTSCTADPNPLCGWCVVENKCSRQSQCQNFSIPDRWTRQDNSQCISVTVDPLQLVLDPLISFREINVTLSSPGLSSPLSGESFSCHLADSLGRFPPIIVPAIEVTPRTEFTCNITGLIPNYPGVSSVINLGFQSSLINRPFDVTNEALTIFRCTAGESCNDCLGPGSPCGWCNLNKQCSGTDAVCRNGSFFLQLDGGSFTDRCPLVGMPPHGAYVQPVRINQDLLLTTLNLIEPTDGFSYSCAVGEVSLTAMYINDTSLQCVVNTNQLLLPNEVGSSEIVTSVIWSGNNINHNLGSVMNQTIVSLYDCRVLAGGCSECVATRRSGFMCGWCGDSCEIMEECSDFFVTEGENCPAPVINSISPISAIITLTLAVRSAVGTPVSTNCAAQYQYSLNETLNLKESCPEAEFRDCCQAMKAGTLFNYYSPESGVYDITNVCEDSTPFALNILPAMQAHCDMKTDNGGWIVLVRRTPEVSPRVNFARNWIDYENGFGDLKGEFWYGLKNMHCLTKREPMQVRIDLKQTNGTELVLTYNTFRIDGPDTQYTLHVGDQQHLGFDYFGHHNERKFSTQDRDNDVHPDGCPSIYDNSGWWFGHCFSLYLTGPPSIGAHTWDDEPSTHAYADMKIRPLSYVADKEPCDE